MFRMFSRGRNIPLDHPPRASNSRLHEAKLAAWSLAIGQSRPSADPYSGMHRHHRGLLDDLPLPQTPERAPRLSFSAIVETIAQAIGLGGSPTAGATALSAGSKASGGKNAEVTYIGHMKIRESRLSVDPAEAVEHSRAA